MSTSAIFCLAVLSLSSPDLAAVGPQQTPNSEFERRADEVDSPTAIRDSLSAAFAKVVRADDARSSAILLRALEVRAARYAAFTSDSFPLDQVRRFRAWLPQQRATKVAADSLRRAGNTAVAQDGVDVAMRLWRRSFRLASGVPDSGGSAAALANLGTGFLRLGSLDSAESYVRRANVIARTVRDRVTQANTLNVLASIYHDRGRIDDAGAHYTAALELRLRLRDAAGAASEHNNLGLLAQDEGNTDVARAEYERSLRLTRVGDAAGASLTNLGNLAVQKGQYRRSADYYREAVVVYERQRNLLDAALVKHNLGLLELRRGDYLAAVRELTGALATYERMRADRERVAVRQDLSLVYTAMGDLELARTTLIKALRTRAADVGHSSYSADLSLAAAEVATHLNALESASRFYEQAAQLYERDGDSRGVADAAEGLGSLAVLRGDYRAAARMFERVVQLRDEIGDVHAGALSRVLLGYAQGIGRTGNGVRTLQRAIADLRTVADSVGEATARAGLGEIELNSGRAERAYAEFSRGLNLVRNRPSSEIVWRLQAGLGRAFAARGNLAAASAALNSALSNVEGAAGLLRTTEHRSGFMADKWATYGDLARVELSRGHVAEAFAVSERMRARQTLGFVSRSPAVVARSRPASPLRHALMLRRHIQALASTADNANAPSMLGSEAIETANRQYTDFLRSLERTRPSDASLLRAQAVSWTDVARSLRRDEVLLEYLLTDSSAHVFVVRRDSITAIPLRINRGQLTSAVEFARATLERSERGLSNRWQPVFARLYRDLIAPVEANGTLVGVKRLVIVPHAELHFLPFAALVRSAADPNFLVQRFELVYAPSGSVWVRSAERAPGLPAGGVLALAPQPRALRGSANEARAIARTYGQRATVWFGGAASKQQFRKHARGFSVLHLATTGVLDARRPLLSYVQLAPRDGDNGRLSVDEVFDLDLPARLVFLSACETALGGGASADVPPGDDWLGLVRAFLHAGAANVIGTLWRVDDRATTRIANHVHAGLLRGFSESQALASAQRVALRDPATSHPYYWAGFVLNGSR